MSRNLQGIHKNKSSPTAAFSVSWRIAPGIEDRPFPSKRMNENHISLFFLFFPSSLIFGTLYPAYYSYKAVKSKDIKEYVKWMMYWIIFALFTTAETFTDIFLCWFPFYYELKIAFVAWLLSPYTKGSSLLYRKFVHPTLSSKEKEIDDCLVQAKDRSYDALVHYGKRGLNVAATAAVMAASKVARLLHFVSSLDLREGQVTPWRGVTNSKLLRSGRAASSHLCPPAHGLDPSRVSLLPTPACPEKQQTTSGEQDLQTAGISVALVFSASTPGAWPSAALPGLDFHLADCQRSFLALVVSAPHYCPRSVGQASDVCSSCVVSRDKVPYRRDSGASACRTSAPSGETVPLLPRDPHHRGLGGLAANMASLRCPGVLLRALAAQ
ncbi:hypothetical protein HPG69_003528, partial [Diceros bicornis minor]